MRVYPTSYLPPISYFCTLLHDNILQGTDTVRLCIEQHETYPKQTLRNRCLITGSNGKQSLTVPVCRAEQQTTCNGQIITTQKTYQVRINYRTTWQHQHWMALVSAYQHTPFFFYYQDFLQPLYQQPCDYLLQWNTQLMQVLFRLLDIPATIQYTSQWEKADDSVFTRLQHTNPEDGTTLPPYWQIFSEKNGFLSNLSIVDILFNIGPEAKDYLYRYAEKS